MKQSNNQVVTYTRTAHFSEWGIATQRHKLEIYCKQNGLSISKKYVDNGISGTTLERPGLSELLADIALGEVKAVLTTGVDRIGRNPLHTIQLIQNLYELDGVNFIFVSEGQTSKDIVELHNSFFLSDPLAQLLAVMEQEGGEDA